MVPLPITYPRKLAGAHRVIIVSECLGKRLRQRLMRMPILSGRRGLDHMTVYTCGKKFLLTSQNSPTFAESSRKLGFTSKTGRIAVAASP